MNLDPELLEYFNNCDFAVVCLRLDLGAGEEGVLLVKSTGELLEGFKKASAIPAVGWIVEGSEHGPVVCLCLHCISEAGEILGESCFDVFDEEDASLLALLSQQNRLKVAMYDEKLELVYMIGARWDEVMQILTQQVLDRAEELAERTATPDFSKSIEHFQSAVSLEMIAEAARGGSEEN
ncbi:hypothetical protein EPN96_02860 [bacterium]|nr:MAG: hypothetical protein EPN96_02860 [bacterium]